MKVAIVGSRSIDEKYYDNLYKTVPQGTSIIISGGAKGADMLAKAYAEENKIDYLEITPDYKKYGKSATIIRNKEIVSLADYVIVLWDGKSRGSSFVMKHCIDTLTPLKVITCK